MIDAIMKVIKEGGDECAERMGTNFEAMGEKEMGDLFKKVAVVGLATMTTLAVSGVALSAPRIVVSSPFFGALSGIFVFSYDLYMYEDTVSKIQRVGQDFIAKTDDQLGRACGNLLRRASHAASSLF